MGTISDKLMRIINTKEDIRQALISKGYDVPTSIPFKEYAKMILDLPCRVDSFPDIEGIVARYSALGLTNEQMAENPIWKDLTGNGHDLQMKNFAWKGMSGVGGYTENYDSNKWYKVASRIDATWTYKSFNVKSIKDNNSAQLFYQSQSSDTGFRVLSCTIKVSGLTDGQGIEYISNGTRPTVIMRIENDGIYHLPSFDFGAKNAYYGFRFLKLQESCNITIEQLPLYPSALVFDGVDDYGTCNNFPILTKEKGYTVVALRQWIEEKNDSTALVSNCKNWGQNGAFLFEYNNLRINFLNVAISFGYVSSVDRGKSPFSYQTSKLYNGKNIEPGSLIGSNKLIVGKGNKDFLTFSKAAIWELVFLDHDATEEELTKIKDYFVKTYPWLFPDQAWTVTGKTNEDEDRATIANITGNGNDLVLSNFAFSGNSGYGLYNIQKFTNWSHVADRGDIVKNGYSVTITNSKITGSSTNYNTDILYSHNSSSTTIIFKVTGLVDGQKIFLGRKSVTDAYVIDKDGIYRSDYNIPRKDGKVIVGIGTVGFTGECNITIEQIPEYEGYLVTDGVDDKTTSSAFEMGKDFTVVGEWRFIIDERKVAGLIKPPSFYLFNENNGLKLFINNTEKSSSLNTKSLKAICSDGRVYFDDWSEMLLSEEQPITSSSKDLSIGYNSTIYTQMAFKNLGIYNDQLLSKDDCIKAYNYLQTLKAK
nr:MAG TPA: hypothetical protein [Caudoviricetes sp.]